MIKVTADGLKVCTAIPKWTGEDDEEQEGQGGIHILELTVADSWELRKY